MTLPVLPPSAPEGGWTDPRLLIPGIALLIVAVVGLVPNLVHSDAPAAIQCGAEVSSFVSAYDDHPEARPSLPASSEDEKQCHVNEYVSHLKPKPKVVTITISPSPAAS